MDMQQLDSYKSLVNSMVYRLENDFKLQNVAVKLEVESGEMRHTFVVRYKCELTNMTEWLHIYCKDDNTMEENIAHFWNKCTETFETREIRQLRHMLKTLGEFADLDIENEIVSTQLKQFHQQLHAQKQLLLRELV